MTSRPRDRHGARLLGFFARDHAITIRQAYRLRDGGDARWVMWLANRPPDDQIQTAGAEDAADLCVSPPEIDPGELGVECEVRRLREECLELAARRQAYHRAGHVTKEMAIQRMLLQTRECLRRIELSSSEIVLSSGSYCSKDDVQLTLGRWLGDIVSLLESMPGNIALAVPPEHALTVRTAADAEVWRLRKSISELEIGTPGTKTHHRVTADPQRGLPLPDNGGMS